MAAKGTEAKNKIVTKMAEIFGEDWIGEYEKKYYVWSSENGQRTQVAISLTCPKTPIEISQSAVEDNSDWDWSGTIAAAPEPTVSAEITQEEIDNVANLLTKLGL